MLFTAVQALRRRLALAATVARYSVMIWLVDWLPRRRILSSEYSGDALEKRLQMRIGGGWRMVAALWRMSTINQSSNILCKGSRVPDLPLLLIGARGDETIRLCALARPRRPLVLNFGSCS